MAADKQPRVVRRSVRSASPKLCPNCLSPLSRGSRLGGWLVPQDYVCDKCGYNGHAYLEARGTDSGETQVKDT